MSGVLVTGAGGPAGIAVIRDLVRHDEFVVAVDTDPLAAGLFLAAAHAVVPSACEPAALVAALADLVARHGIDAVVCTVAEEMPAIACGAATLGAAVWLPDPAAVERCLDKRRFSEVLKTAGVRTPCTALGADAKQAATTVPGPWIVKPRWGRGSRDVFAIDDPDDLAWPCRRIADPIVQHRVTGREFTVDVLTDRDGTVVGAVPRWRVETKAGISTKGCTFMDPAVIDAATRAINAVGLAGIANVQGFVTDSGIVIVEINPRFSGGLPLSIAAGAELVTQFVRATRGETIDPAALTFSPGITMTRHLVEVFPS